MTYAPICTRWLLLLMGLLFAVASVQSVVAAHAASLPHMSADGSMAAAADSPPCHHAPAKSNHGNKPDCCASDLTCFNKCGSAVVAISVDDVHRELQRSEAAFEPSAWTDVTPKPPIHPPSV